MSEIMYVCVALAALNATLALVLGATYVRNHREVRSPFTLGLVLFAAFLLVNNGMTLYHFVTMMPAFQAVDESLVLVEAGLQTAALVALTSATMR
jgi:hypothetical protein